MTFIVFTAGNYARCEIPTKNALFNALLITAAKLFRCAGRMRAILFQLLYRIICPCVAFGRSMHTLSGHNGTILKFAAEFSPIIQQPVGQMGDIPTYCTRIFADKANIRDEFELCCEEMRAQEHI